MSAKICRERLVARVRRSLRLRGGIRVRNHNILTEAQNLNPAHPTGHRIAAVGEYRVNRVTANFAGGSEIEVSRYSVGGQ
jgi:hypothetical protein